MSQTEIQDGPHHEATSRSESHIDGEVSFIAPWRAGYERRWIQDDVIAGITVAAYAIPVSLAYASLAGVPPHYGIYCYLLGGAAYVLFGTSRQLAIGPTSAISICGLPLKSCSMWYESLTSP